MRHNKNILQSIGMVILIFMSIACRKKDNANTPIEYGLFTKNIIVDGTTRRYAIYIPKNLGGSPYPLIFELHGGGVYLEDMTGESGFKSPYKLWMQKADSEKFVVVFPEGLNGTYGKPTWNDCRANSIVSSTANDISFISKLIDEISASYTINANRIYASGTSNGGLMALRLAVELSDRIAAVAAVVSAMADSSECGQPINPISLLFMNGTNDNNLPYTGGTVGNPPNPNHGTVFSTETSINIWTNFNQTDTIPIINNLPDLDSDDGGSVSKYTYSNGNENTEVVLYKVLGGGHSAPSILEQYSSLFEQSFGKQNHDIEMTTEVWNFFKDKTLN